MKEPDFFIRPEDFVLPTVAFESGWSETYPRLHSDMNLLLVGGNGAIKVVIIANWTRRSGGRVAGTLEVWKLDRRGVFPQLQQREDIYPVPGSAASQHLTIRRRDLFGSALMPGRNGNDILNLDMELLRKHALKSLNVMNLGPA